MSDVSATNTSDSQQFKSISTDDLFNLLGSSNLRIVDARPVDAYNGWKLNEEKRGGHIPGAKSLPVKWLRYIDWIEIVANKNILPEQTIVIYGYDDAQTVKTAEQFARAGYSDILLYHDFASEWCERDDLPLEKLARYRQLVPATWLNELITTGTADEYDNSDFVICHGHYRNQSDYEIGHIPGALSLDTLQLESPETWNRRSPAELKDALEKLGISQDTTVILYGRFSFPDNNDPFPGSAAGHLGSIRCAMIMIYAGVKDVRVLNGGIQSWEDEGYSLSTETPPAPQRATFGADIPACPEIIVDTPEAKKILKSPDKNLVSVRSWSEYIGEVSGYNYIEKKGRIPGSVFGNCGSDAYHMENYRNLDYTTREYHKIAEIWAEVGVTPDKHNAFYCGTGWRGSEAFLNAWLMGWPRVSVYDGGWFEWSSDATNPYETGIPE